VSTVAVAVAAVVGTSVVPTVATPPQTGATYQGQIIGAPTGQDAVTFTVNKRGTSVRKLSVGPYVLRASCGSGGEPPAQSAKPAPIKNGKFTAKVVYRSETGDVVARAKVTGTFLRHGREKGTVTAVSLGADACEQSMPYRTHVED
jgi:hypothetical protein